MQTATQVLHYITFYNTFMTIKLCMHYVCTLNRQEVLHHAGISAEDDHSVLNVQLSNSLTALTKIKTQLQQS